MRVRVRQTLTTFGWYGKQRRYPGDEFDIAGTHELGSWMEPLIDSPPPAPKKRGRLSRVTTA